MKIFFDNEHQKVWQENLDKLIQTRFASRLKAKDHTLWGTEAASEAKKRLDWLDAPKKIADALEQANQLKDFYQRKGIDRVVLCGMGGSTLGAQLLAGTFGGDLIALDTTHPHEIESGLNKLSLPRTLVIVSTKSGTTVETLSQLFYAEKVFEESSLDPRNHILIITDPGTTLADYAAKKSYQISLGSPNIGGRFSVLSAYGVVPAVLANADLTIGLENIENDLLIYTEDHVKNPALQLAASLYESATAKHVAQFSAAPELSLLPFWIEQLVAESTGKNGKGLLPLPRTEKTVTPYGGILLHSIVEGNTAVSGPDITLSGTPVQHILLWQIATTALSYLLQVNPFDQPNVEATKRRARAIRESGFSNSDTALKQDPNQHETAFHQNFSEKIKYLIIQAFIEENPADIQVLEEICVRIENQLQVPVALSFGPRYLHSTGQMHKGGPQPVGIVQLHSEFVNDLAVPNENYSFGDLEKSWVSAERESHEKLKNPVVTFAARNMSELTNDLKNLFNFL